MPSIISSGVYFEKALSNWTWSLNLVMLGAGFIKFHQLFQNLLVIGEGKGGGGGGHSNSVFYSVKLCVMINFSLQHNVLCLSFVVVLYSMYSLYAVIKRVLLDERGCHVQQELEA